MTIENRAWRRSHEVREAIAAKQKGERAQAPRPGRGSSGGPRAASTYRAARIPSGTVKVRGVYPHKIDHKTWRALYRSKKWPAGNGLREVRRRLDQKAKIAEREASALRFYEAMMRRAGLWAVR